MNFRKFVNSKLLESAKQRVHRIQNYSEDILGGTVGIIFVLWKKFPSLNYSFFLLSSSSRKVIFRMNGLSSDQQGALLDLYSSEIEARLQNLEVSKVIILVIVHIFLLSGWMFSRIITKWHNISTPKWGSRVIWGKSLL